jgi:hypothetical protein
LARIGSGLGPDGPCPLCPYPSCSLGRVPVPLFTSLGHWPVSEPRASRVGLSRLSSGHQRPTMNVTKTVHAVCHSYSFTLYLRTLFASNLPILTQTSPTVIVHHPHSRPHAAHDSAEAVICFGLASSHTSHRRVTVYQKELHYAPIELWLISVDPLPRLPHDSRTAYRRCTKRSPSYQHRLQFHRLSSHDRRGLFPNCIEELWPPCNCR